MEHNNGPQMGNPFPPSYANGGIEHAPGTVPGLAPSWLKDHTGGGSGIGGGKVDDGATADLPPWFRLPSQHTPDERAHRAAFMRSPLSPAYAAKIEAYAQEAVKVCSTQKALVRWVARKLDVQEISARSYLVGLRVISPMVARIQRGARPGSALAKARAGRTMRAKAVQRGPLELKRLVARGGVAGAYRAKPENLTPPVPTRTAMEADIALANAIQLAFTKMTPAGRAWLLANLNTESR